MNLDQLIAKLKRLQGKGTQRELAASLGISNAYLTEILNGKKEPGPSVLDRLGLERKTTYVDKTR